MRHSFEQRYEQYRHNLDGLAGLRKLFVSGCAKSGTTWLANLLDGHPAIVMRGEGAFTWRVAPAFLQLFDQLDLNRAHEIVKWRPLDRMLAIRSLLDNRLARYVEESGRPIDQLEYVGDKTPQYTESIAVLDQLFPNAMFVHIIRDPRDVATSAWFHVGRSNAEDLNQHVRHYLTVVWPHNVRSARAAAQGLGNRYVEVRYEDLLTREREETRRILRALDVDASDGAIEACRRSGDFKRRSGGRERGETGNGLFRRGVAGDWVNHLPHALVDDLCVEIADLMTAFGYDPSSTMNAASSA